MATACVDRLDRVNSAAAYTMKRSAAAAAHVPHPEQLATKRHNVCDTIVGLLGSGTYGHVYAAESSDGQAFALKVMCKPKCSLDFQDMAREIYGLDTEGHLLAVYAGAHNRLAASMPLMGQRLGNSVVPKLTAPCAASLLKPIATVLSRMHGMHRDVKPANILLPFEKSQESTLIDFSLTTWQHISTDPSVVTLWYRAPEIILKMAYTNAIDVWALGIIILNVLTGAHVTRNLQEEASSLMLLDLLDAFGWPNDWPELDHILLNLFKCMPTRGPACGTYNILGAISDNNNSEHAALATDLLKGMLQVNPTKRFSWTTVLQHPFWTLASAEANAQICKMPKIELDTSAQDFVSRAKKFSSLRSARGRSANGIGASASASASASGHEDWFVSQTLLSTPEAIKTRVYELDYLIHYGKKMNYKMETCILAYWINVHALSEMPSAISFITGSSSGAASASASATASAASVAAPLVVRLCACLFLASAFNEDTRVNIIELEDLANLWDEPGNAPKICDAITAILCLTRGHWPGRAIQTFYHRVKDFEAAAVAAAAASGPPGPSVPSVPPGLGPWARPFMCIFSPDAFESGQSFLSKMIQDNATSITSRY